MTAISKRMLFTGEQNANKTTLHATNQMAWQGSGYLLLMIFDESITNEITKYYPDFTDIYVPDWVNDSSVWQAAEFENSNVSPSPKLGDCEVRFTYTPPSSSTAMGTWSGDIKFTPPS